MRCALTKALSAPVQYVEKEDPFLVQRPKARATPVDPLKYVSNASMMSIPETDEVVDFDDDAENRLHMRLRIPIIKNGVSQVWTGEGDKENCFTPISTPLFGETIHHKLPLGALLAPNGTPVGKATASPGYATMSNESALQALRRMIREREAPLRDTAAIRAPPVRLDLAACVAPPPLAFRSGSSFASTASTLGGDPMTPPPPVPEFPQRLPPPPLQLDEGMGAEGAPQLSGFERMAARAHGSWMAPLYYSELRSNNVNYAQHQLSSCPIGEQQIREQTMREELVRCYRAALARGDAEGASRFLDAALKLGVANAID